MSDPREESWTRKEVDRREDFFECFTDTPVPDDDLLENLGLYIRRQSLSRILFMFELYKEAFDCHGDILDLGTRWGQNMALFANFRGMLEPHNTNRKIVGFDTFAGFPESSISDVDGEGTDENTFTTVEGYE